MASVAIAAEKPKGFFSRPIDRAEWRQLANWLLVWVVVANFGFALMWFIGAPPRQPEIIAIGVTGLIVRNQPRWVQFIAFIAVMIYAVLGFLAGLFNLAITSLLHSLKFFVEMNPSQSSEYMIGAGVIAAMIGTAFLCLKRRQGFTDLRIVLLAILVFMSLSYFDRWMGQGMRGHYKREAVAGAPFTSAVNLSGFGPVAGAPKRNLMIVIVESLGQPVDNPEMLELLFARYRESDVTGRFTRTTGDTTYYNSTTAGEVRELCGRWGDYYDLLDRNDSGCLPARLAREGYETSAYHSFAGAFFERETWYPHIGFQNRVFADQLLPAGLQECGGVFPGACDREMPRVLANKLKSGGDKPQFVYWLTVNSHLPVPPGENLDDDNCARISPKLNKEFPMVCRQFAIYHDIDAALAKEITAPDFPPTDILIVGDHMPPYFDRHTRSQFEPDRVPWLLLRWKDDQLTPTRSAVIAGSAVPAAKG